MIIYVLQLRWYKEEVELWLKLLQIKMLGEKTKQKYLTLNICFRQVYLLQEGREGGQDGNVSCNARPGSNNFIQGVFLIFISENNFTKLNLSVTSRRSFGGATLGRREMAPPDVVPIFSKPPGVDETFPTVSFWFRLDLKDTLVPSDVNVASSSVIFKPLVLLYLSMKSFMLAPKCIHCFVHLSPTSPVRLSETD